MTKKKHTPSLNDDFDLGAVSSVFGGTVVSCYPPGGGAVTKRIDDETIEVGDAVVFEDAFWFVEGEGLFWIREREGDRTLVVHRSDLKLAAKNPRKAAKNPRKAAKTPSLDDENGPESQKGP